MKPAKLESLIWMLIYGGLLLAGLGLAVQRTDDPLGWGMVVVGALAAVIGVVLIWVRSRQTS